MTSHPFLISFYCSRDIVGAIAVWWPWCRMLACRARSISCDTHVTCLMPEVDEHGRSVPFGAVFACLMTACMIGSSLFGLMLKHHVPVPILPFLPASCPCLVHARRAFALLLFSGEVFRGGVAVTALGVHTTGRWNGAWRACLGWRAPPWWPVQRRRPEVRPSAAAAGCMR